MNRKSLYTMGVILLLLSFVLSACAGGAATQAPEAATEAPAVTEAQLDDFLLWVAALRGRFPDGQSNDL